MQPGARAPRGQHRRLGLGLGSGSGLGRNLTCARSVALGCLRLRNASRSWCSPVLAAHAASTGGWPHSAAASARNTQLLGCAAEGGSAKEQRARRASSRINKHTHAAHSCGSSSAASSRTACKSMADGSCTLSIDQGILRNFVPRNKDCVKLIRGVKGLKRTV